MFDAQCKASATINIKGVAHEVLNVQGAGLYICNLIFIDISCFTTFQKPITVLLRHVYYNTLWEPYSIDFTILYNT